MIATPMSIFRRQFLSTSTGKASKVTSTPMPLEGNKAVLAVTILNSTGPPDTTTIQMQGTYDGTAWETIGSGLSQDTFGYVSEAAGSLDYAQLRVAAEITDTDVALLFDASVTMTKQ